MEVSTAIFLLKWICSRFLSDKSDLEKFGYQTVSKLCAPWSTGEQCKVQLTGSSCTNGFFSAKRSTGSLKRLPNSSELMCTVLCPLIAISTPEVLPSWVPGKEWKRSNVFTKYHKHLMHRSYSHNVCNFSSVQILAFKVTFYDIFVAKKFRVHINFWMPNKLREVLPKLFPYILKVSINWN